MYARHTQLMYNTLYSRGKHTISNNTAGAGRVLGKSWLTVRIALHMNIILYYGLNYYFK